MRVMSKTIGIRVDEELEKEIDSLSETLRINKSQLIKKAFREWHRTRQGIQGQNMMLVDRVLIAELFNKLSKEEITDIANTFSNHVLSLIRMRQIENNIRETIEQFLETFLTLIGNQHFGWFSNINYTLDQFMISIYGFHTLNQNYSKYAVNLLSNVLYQEYNYKLIKEKVTLTDNSFIIQLKDINTVTS